MKNPFILLAFTLFFISCKTKKVVETEASIDSLSIYEPNEELGNPLRANIKFYESVLIPPKFEHIKITSKLKVETPDNYLPTLDATLYIQNNKKVWMNLSFFINVARGVATPEGIKGFVKTEKKYIDSDFEYLNNLLNTNFINYKTLEKLLMGRTFVRINDREFLLTQTKEGYRMKSTRNQIMESNGNKREYKIDLTYSSNYDLLKIILQDVNSDDLLEVNYNNWEKFKDFKLPKYVKIIIKGAKESQIILENTKFDDSEINTPFSIPRNYMKIEI